MNRKEVKSLKNRLKEMRLKMNITQEELALKSGTSRTTISDIESGKKAVVTNVTLEKLANALGFKITDIFFTE